MVLLALRQHFRKSYRDFCEVIEVCTDILDELGLKRVPHWTTLHKFSKRANTRRLETFFLLFIEDFYRAQIRKVLSSDELIFKAMN